MVEEDLERSEERSGTAAMKLAEASHAADEASRFVYFLYYCRAIFILKTKNFILKKKTPLLKIIH